MKSFFQLFRKKRVIFAAVIVILGLFFWGRSLLSPKVAQYQTAQVTRGTIISTVSESGQVVASNRVEITSQASGVINHVYVKDGDTVTAGETIADMTLDTDGAKNQAQAYASYLAAQSNLNNANAQVYTLHSGMFSKWKTFTDIANNSTYQNPDGSPNASNRQLAQFIEVNDDWLASQAQYQNAQTSLAQAQAAFYSSSLSYQAASATITAPQSGVITDIVIAPGLQVKSSTTTNGTTIASQPVASIQTEGSPIVSASLSEVDAVKVTTGQKATITFDALPDASFTGKVSGIDTSGVVSSGVSTYPATIVLDVQNNKILPNMSATVNIITGVKDNVLTAPTSAIQSVGGQSTVRVLKNGKITTTPVMTGAASDSETEIVSGLSEGDTVVIGFVPTATSGNSASPFSRSLFGGFGGGGGGGGNRTFIRGN